MPVKNNTLSNDIELQEFRGNSREEILRSDLKFTSTKYFTERWIPNLGFYPKGFSFPARRSAGQAAGRSALLILDLRQFTRWEKGKPMLISREALARRLNKSVRTIQTILNEPLVNWFVKKLPKEYYTKNGQTLRSPNKFLVRQDEPLIPQDIENLIRTWQKKRENSPDITVHELLEQTLDEDVSTLRAPTSTAPLMHPEWFHNGPLSVLDAIQLTCPGEKVNKEIKKMADLVQNAIIQPEKVIGGTKYFREKWMPKLGTAGWLLLLLRNEGFLDKDKNIERDLIKMRSPQKYAAILGVSTEQVIRMLKNDLGEWIEVKSEQKRSDQSIERTLKVFLREKLTTKDQEKVYQLYEMDIVNKKPQEVASTPEDLSEKVTQTRNSEPRKVALTVAEEPRKVALTVTKEPRKVALTVAKEPRKVALTVAEEPRKVALIQRLSSKTSKHEEKHHNQRQTPRSQNKRDDDDENIKLPKSILTMLTQMGWDDTTSVIEKHYKKDSIQVTAWAKYTLQKPGLTNRAGYFRKRLLSGEKAPVLPNSQDSKKGRSRYTSDKYAGFLD